MCNFLIDKPLFYQCFFSGENSGTQWFDEHNKLLFNIVFGEYKFLSLRQTAKTTSDKRRLNPTNSAICRVFSLSLFLVIWQKKDKILPKIFPNSYPFGEKQKRGTNRTMIPPTTGHKVKNRKVLSLNKKFLCEHQGENSAKNSKQK